MKSLILFLLTVILPAAFSGCSSNEKNMVKTGGLEIVEFRALFNHILSTQNPENGHVTYNLSLAMGGFNS
jgi:hypothetical protein